jgi:hypothetical protein
MNAPRLRIRPTTEQHNQVVAELKAAARREIGAMNRRLFYTSLAVPCAGIAGIIVGHFI